jgi:6-pyruvoyltetrahydropterin/6-carboxytetrahydropterin synthase
MEVTKVFEIHAAHRLYSTEWTTERNEQLWGKCTHLHGHTWQLQVTISARVNETSGMVLNFSELKRIVTEQVIDKLDHNYLNDVVPLPTCENLLVWIKDQLHPKLPQLSRLTLYETPTSYATLDVERI